MKNKLITFLLLSISVQCFFSQERTDNKIETVSINGEQYFVYPFGQDLLIHNDLWRLVRYRRSSNDRKSFKEWYILDQGEAYNKREFRKARREAYVSALRYLKYYKNYRHLRKPSVKRAIRCNPYPLMEPQYTLENDVIPSLDPIPDGKYVQFFSNYFTIGKRGFIQGNDDQKVAGFFSIKNNMLEGDAIWLNAKGDTLKFGRFDKGQKSGKWYLESRKLSSALSKKDALEFVNANRPSYCDTTIETVHYKNGIKDGFSAVYNNSVFPVVEGHYTKGSPSGEWKYRDIRYSGIGKNRTRNRYNDVITWQYTSVETDLVVKQPLIRHKLYKEDFVMNSVYDFASKYTVSFSPTKIYRINYGKEVDLELDEEKINSYEGEEYEDEYIDEGYYDEYAYENEEDLFAAYRGLIYDVDQDKSVPVHRLIDSLGVIFNYDGHYEKRYPNGQLMVRYEFKNGSLLKEDTIFWDNGNVYDVIEYLPDSLQYIQKIYDYTGKLYHELVYDQNGAFVRVNFRPDYAKKITLGEFEVTSNPGDRFLFYDQRDTANFALKDSLVLFRSWFEDDQSLLYSRSYDPIDRTLTYEQYSIAGNRTAFGEMQFSGDFESWNGHREYNLGNIRVETTTSAGLSEWYEKDSIPQAMINLYDEAYDLSDDVVLFYKNKPFTGKFGLKTRTSNLMVNKGRHISVILPDLNYPSKLSREVLKYRMTDKTKYKLLFNTIDASEVEEEYSQGIFTNLIKGFLPNIEYPYSYDELSDETFSQRKQEPFIKTIKGEFKDGKPEGTWRIYDQFGKLLQEMNFERGMQHGPYKVYETIDPKKKYDFFEEELPDNLKDSVPKRKTHYLFSSGEFKNGLENGKYKRYNWFGGIEQEINFVDGLASGPSFEKNKLAYTYLNYLDGELDGYVRTYLTLNGTDSTLLYDLNFQNGLLQGESKAYHLSGRLAKRGFFLNGESIDDYEAYDTLGFRYHYVKFQYGFPIEEKIWEENELSVRYLFDWRDSIYFQPTDITTSQSLDRALANIGLGQGYYRQPYFGRPSLVNKEGVSYHLTKYYPNDSIARDGDISSGKKVSCWKYYGYDGEFLYEADYFDTIITINDSIQFKSKGILIDYDRMGKKLSESYIIEKFEKYDCSHTDHYEIRQLMTIWQGKDSVDRMNGFVKNYYDNGVLQNEGMMKGGLPTGVWKFYDPYGKLNQVGSYVMGKRHGRWLGGDLSKTKYLGDICLNPNLPDLENELKYREKQLDIFITNYHLGKALNKEFYDVDLNEYEQEEMDEEK